MSLQNWLKVGLASEQFGAEVHDRIRNVSGSATAVTLGATSVSLGFTTSSMGFFGAAVTAKPTSVTLNNVTSIAAALSNLGLIGTTTP